MLGPRSKLTKLVIRLLAIFIGALLTILIAVPLLGPCWHLLHGDAISFEGWRVPVPKGFYARKSETATVMWKQSLGIPFFNVPYGHISLFRPPQQVFSFDRNYGRFKSELIQDASEKGYRLRSERTVSVGDKPAYCLEFKRPSPDARSLVRCVVEGSPLAIFYEGDSKYVPDVFATLQGISRENGPMGMLHPYDKKDVFRRERYVKGILCGRGGVEHCAGWRGGRHSDAARTEQEGASEVAEAGCRAGAERAECGGVLPGASVVRAALLLVEEAAAGGGLASEHAQWRRSGEAWRRRQVRGSAAGPPRRAGRERVRGGGPCARAARVRLTRGWRYGCGTGGAWWWGEAVTPSKCGCWWGWWKRRDGAAEFAGARWGASRAHLAGGGSDGHALRV